MVAVALGLVLAGIVIKAASADLTWDEAWTYLFYGRTPLGFLRLDYANDHPLNSLLIYASQRSFGNSELIIRLPNVLAAGLYLWVSARLICSVRLRSLAFGLCVLQPYLFDYFALARGYGIAAALMQLGLVLCFFDERGRERYGVLLLTCLVASLSVFSTVGALYAILAAEPASQWLTRRGLRVREWRLSLGFAVAGLVPVAGLLWVSREGVPVYGSQEGFFAAIPQSIAGGYVGAHWAAPVATVGVLGLAAMVAVGLRRFGRRATTLLLASGFSMVGFWVAARFSGKPLPTGRVLLPFVPLWNLTVLAMAEDIHNAAGPHIRRWIQRTSAMLCLTLAILFMSKLHFQRYADWPEDYRLQNRLVQSLARSGGCLPPNVWERYGHVYYIDRWFPPELRPPDVRCPGP